VLYVPVKDLASIDRLDPSNAPLWLAEGVAFAKKMLVGKLRSDPDKDAWIYEMHHLLALLVADDLARTYLTDPGTLSSPGPLQQAEPLFRARIAKVWPGRPLTPRRLAMALVDAKFGNVRRPLLDPHRQVGHIEATLWGHLLPPKRRRRLHALIQRDGYVARWCRRWRSLMIIDPLELYPACRPPGSKYRWHAPGEENLAIRIWHALYS
jgi:hypothetical protein